MSSKKFLPPVRNQSSSARKRNTPSRNQDLNVTVKPKMVASSSKDTSCNVTMCPSISTPVTLAPDWELQCDMAFNNYLQQLFVKRITEKAIAAQTIQMNDEISKQTNMLLELTDKKNEVEQQIEMFKLGERIKQQSVTLNTVLDDIIHILSPEVEEKLKHILGIMAKACDALYLSKIKPLESQDEYDKFEHLMQGSVDALKMMIGVSGETERIQALTDALKAYLELCKEIENKEEKIVNLQDGVATGTLKCLSEMFTEYRGYNNEVGNDM